MDCFVLKLSQRFQIRFSFELFEPDSFEQIHRSEKWIYDEPSNANKDWYRSFVELKNAVSYTT
jgi:hypothetical protein